MGFKKSSSRLLALLDKKHPIDAAHWIIPIYVRIAHTVPKNSCVFFVKWADLPVNRSGNLFLKLGFHGMCSSIFVFSAQIYKDAQRDVLPFLYIMNLTPSRD